MSKVLSDWRVNPNQGGRCAGALQDGTAPRVLQLMPNNVIEIRTLGGTVLYRENALAGSDYAIRSVDGLVGEDGRAVLVCGGFTPNTGDSRTVVIDTDYPVARVTPLAQVTGDPTLVGPAGVSIKGNQGDPGPKGDRGDRGPQGPQGPRGDDAMALTGEQMDQLSRLTAERVWDLPPRPDNDGLPEAIRFGTRPQQDVAVMLINQALWQHIRMAQNEADFNLEEAVAQGLYTPPHRAPVTQEDHGRAEVQADQQQADR